MDEDPIPIISNPPADPTATGQLGSTQLPEYQGSQSSPVRVEVTVLRALNVPHIKKKFGGKREYTVTMTYQETTKKIKRTKRTKGAQIEEQTVTWNQKLDAIFVQPSSHLVLCLYAKRLTQGDLLIGTHEITIPTESEIDISFVLGHGNGQASQSTQPVTLNLTIIVPAIRTSPSAHPNILNEGDDAPAEEIPTTAVTPDYSGPDQSAEPEHTLPRPDHISAERSTPIPQDQGETSLVEKALTGLDLADKAEKSIDRSNSWEGVVGRIKWVMDTLSPVAELHPIAQMAYSVVSVIPQELSNQYQRDDKIRSLVKSMHDAFDFTRHGDTLNSIKPKSEQAKILSLMLRDVCGCSDFIQSYTKDSRFAVRMVKNIGSGVEEKVQELSATLNEHRRAFLDHALITTEITAFQILNDVGNISAKVDGISTRLEWVSRQVLDATLDAKIGEIAYREGSRFSPGKGCLPGTRTVFLDFIVDWVNNPASERVLVLFGLAGTGKSSIAHEIAHRCYEMGRLTSSFFFVRKEHSKSEAYHLFTNLAHDLADRYPLFKAALGRVVKDDTSLRRGTRDYSTLFQRLILEPLKDLHTVGPILVVIDALDESGDASGERGLHRFLANNLSSLPSNFRVLITSRPEDGIESAFRAAESVDIKRMSDDHLATTTHGDILTFLRETLPPDNFKQYGEALARKAEGLFQWAAVACGYILKPGSKKRIELLLQSNAALHGQDQLATLYKEVLEEYFSDEVAQGLFRSVVGQLLAAFEPLSIHSLTTLRRHIPSDEDEDPDSVVETLRHLGSLLSNVTSSDHSLPVVPLHTSFRDFVTNKEKSGDFCVDLHDAHHQLAHSCLSLMLDDLKFNICDLETSYLANKDVEGLDVRIAKHLPPVLSYACRLWDEHLERLDFGTDLLGKLETFFKEKFLFWLEALSLVDNVRLAPPALSSLSIWLASGQDVSRAEPLPEQEGLRLFISDASVFVRYFGTAITRSAPHVYLSALPFAPTDSLVSACYLSSFPHTLRVERGRLSHWPSPEMVISNVGGAVFSIAISPDGQRIVSGTNMGTICVWNTTIGEAVVGPFTRHTGSVNSVGFSPDGQWVVSDSSACTICVWDVTTGEVVAGPFTGHTDNVTSVAFSPDGKQIVSGSYDKSICVWDATTGEVVTGPFTGHTHWVYSVGFSPDGQWIVSGSHDQTIGVWDAKTGKAVAGPFTGHTGPVRSVGFSPDGQWIVSGSDDQTILVWDANTGKAVAGPFTGHTHWVSSVAFSPDGRWIVSGSHDRTVCVWDARTGEVVAGPFTGHTDWVSSVSFSPDGQQIFSGSYDGTICMWNAKAEKAGPLIKQDPVTSVGFSPDGQRIVSSMNDGAIHVWNATTGETVAGPFTAHSSHVLSVGFSPDGQWIVSGSYDKTILVWDANTGKAVAGPFIGHTGAVYSVGFSPDGQWVVSGSDDHTICVWDVTTGEVVAGPFTVYTYYGVRSVGFSPDGKQIVSGSYNTICVWDATTGEVVAGPFIGHIHWIYSVGFSPDGEWIVSGSSDKTICVWDAKTGKAVAGPFTGHTDSVNSVGFSSDGQWIVSGSNDKTICVWDARTGKIVAGPFTGHTDCVSSVGFSPDGKQIVSGSWDGTIRMWNATTRDTVTGQFTEHTGLVSSGEVNFRDQSVIDDDGWICGKNQELLMWIPPVYRTSLHRPSSIWFAGPYEARLDLSDFVHGRSWMRCIDP